MKKLLLSLGFVAVSSSLVAALPPYWDSVRQIEAVLGSRLVAGKIHGAIKAVVKAQGLTYVVRTDRCVAKVALEAHAPQGMGPTTYSVETVLESACDRG